MANAELVAALKAPGAVGKDIIGEWQNAHPCTVINLSDAKLSDVDLSDVHLNDARLLNTDLTNANLEGASLEYATVLGANLEGAKLRGATIQSAHGLELTRGIPHPGPEADFILELRAVHLRATAAGVR